LENRPEIINESPYEDGWIYKLKGSDAAQLDGLMDAGQYEASVKA